VCLEAAESLASSGIDIEVLDLRSLKPVDWARLDRSVRKTEHFLAAFDGPGFSSYGKFLAAEIGARYWKVLKGPPLALGGLDIASVVPAPAEALAGITAPVVCQEVKRLFRTRPRSTGNLRGRRV
jgi:pyruvate dehydrogenase E1 component beta subunit